MRYLATLLITIVLFSCDDVSVKNDNFLPDAIGPYSDVLVICDDVIWEAGVKEAVEEQLSKEIEGLLQPEREFDLSHINIKGFTKLFKKQREILAIAVSPRVKTASLSRKKDVFANGQKYVQVKAPNVAEAIKLIRNRGLQIFKEFSNHRTDQIHNRIKFKNAKKLESKLKEERNIKLTIPSGYKVDTDSSDFTYYFRKEPKPCEYGKSSSCYYQNGIMVYSFPYESEEMFTGQFMVNYRDSITEQYLTSVNSTDSNKKFMQVERLLPISELSFTKDGKYTYLMKGWWKLKNGVMGGPFVTVAIVDEKRNRVVCADGFCYGPNFSKRQFIKQLEAVCLSLSTN